MGDLYLHEARKEASSRLAAIIADLGDAQALIDGHACVYATGSFGRLEAGPNSDLDLFVIVDTAENDEGKLKPLLDRVDEIKLQYGLITAAENNDVAKFDRGGEFLGSHEIQSYTEWLGSNQDDYRNTLTGRMLMLLESRVLVGRDVYHKTIEQVLDKYFRDFGGHEDNFLPAFLFNDILRMWRTFCVNYEFYRRDGDSRDKIKNIKLKFSRMLTCFSGVIYLLAVYAKQNTVRRENVQEMIALSPTERLEAISSNEFWDGDVDAGIRRAVDEALNRYSEFLELTHKEIKKAVKAYKAEEESWRERSHAFGGCLADLVDVFGGMSEGAARLRRLIII